MKDTKWQSMFKIVQQHSSIAYPKYLFGYQFIFLKRFILDNILVFSFQLIGLQITTLATQSVIWYAAGTAVAFTFFYGERVLFGIWLGSFFAYHSAHFPSWAAMQSATVCTLEISVLYHVSQRFVSPTLFFDQANKLLKFILLSLLVTFVSSLWLETIVFSLMPSIRSPLWVVLNAWLANLNGIFIFASAAMMLDYYFLQTTKFKALFQKKWLCVYGLLSLLTIILLLSHSHWKILLLAIAIFLIISSINIFFGWHNGVMATFLVGLLLSLPMHHEGYVILSFQIFLCMLIFTCFFPIAVRTNADSDVSIIL